MRRRTWLNQLVCMGAMLLIMTVSFPVQAAYTPLTVDLLVHEGDSKSIAIQVLNLTPYKIVLATDLANMHSETDKNRDKSKWFAYAPTGVPNTIPAANNNLHPVPMIIAFKDGDQGVASNFTKWRVQGVPNADSTGTTPPPTKDVVLTLNINRPDANSDLKSGLFELIGTVVKDCIDIVKLIVEPENPLAWVEAFAGIIETTTEGVNFSKENSASQEGNKVYVSSYIIANDGNGQPGTKMPPGATPSQSENGTWADDAVITEQPDMNGYAESNLVVITQLLRNPVPQMTVTVVTKDDFITATTASVTTSTSAGGNLLHQTLLQKGKQGKLHLRTLIHSMKRSEKNLLWEATSALHSHKNLTPAQELLLKKLAEALKNNAKTI